MKNQTEAKRGALAAHRENQELLEKKKDQINQGTELVTDNRETT